MSGSDDGHLCEQQPGRAVCIEFKDFVFDDESYKEDKFNAILTASSTDLEELKRLSWLGIPRNYRSTVWKLLLVRVSFLFVFKGYVPLTVQRREDFLRNKRGEYDAVVRRYLGDGIRRDEEIYHQIFIDVPRTFPEEPLVKHSAVREALIRVLYCHAIRRPASGYVQGMNDLATPLFDAFSNEYLRDHVLSMSGDELGQVEADVFWCLGKLLDSVQDNYTFNQAGLYKRIHTLKEIVKRADCTYLSS